MRRTLIAAAVLASAASLLGAGPQAPSPPPSPAPSPAAEPSPTSAASPQASPRPGLTGRPSAPQPLQKQSLDYFIGRWSFKWTGRESALSTGGVVEGTMAMAALEDSAFLEGRTEGKAKSGPFGERVLIGFDEDKKSLVLLEQRGAGLEVLGLGDWTSPVAIRFKVAPLQVRGQTLRLKLTVSVLSGHSFTLAEELSEGGGPFLRLGNAVFSKLPAGAPATPDAR